jgi:GNAT superfamily N-acetyltransferase
MATVPELPIDAPYLLPDGRSLKFGRITRASRPVIERAIEGLSPLTSYRRFFTVRYRLSDAELDALTDLDGISRFAVGAYIRGGSAVDGVGVARFVRDRERPHVADFALLVVDAFQGLGVGRTLIARLAGAALARGIDTFRGMVLVDNAPMLRLLRGLTPGLHLWRVDNYYEVEAPLSSMTLPSGSSM